jgi:antirestriction protein ArdC
MTMATKDFGFDEKSWNELLEKALNEPGIISDAYSTFHNYSIGNQILVMWQCAVRGMDAGPVCTYNHWTKMGRQVRYGEKGLWMWVPVKKVVGMRENEDGEDEPVYGLIGFKMKKLWFVLDQTDGDKEPEFNVPEFDVEKALEILEIEQVKYTKASGNCQGYARDRQVSVNPLAKHPEKTLFHEMAHVLLGHTREEERSDVESLTYADGEVEAEGVAFIVSEALGIGAGEESRGYIQHWMEGHTTITNGGSVDERSAQVMFGVANKILQAGRGKKVS